MTTILNSDQTLPESFKSIFWSYDFSKIDTAKMQKTIIVNTLNYGNLEHWKWIRNFYGDDKIRSILSLIPVTEIRDTTKALIEILFGFNNWNYAQRGSK